METEPTHLAGRPIAVSPAELDRRRTQLLATLDELGCDLIVTFDASSFTYLSGYYLAGNERPFSAVLDTRGELTLMVPLLKEADVRARARADRVLSYRDYPGQVHPIRALATVIDRSGARRPALEAVGHASPFGYRGPNLADCLAAPAVHHPGIVGRMRMVKSAEEIALIRHASDWAVHAQCLLAGAVRPGRTESQVAGEATGAAKKRLQAYYGDQPVAARPLSIAAGFGGQVGPDGTAHHLQLALDPALRAGDLLISTVPAHVGGYYSDVERTMVCQHATPQVADLFGRGLEIHQFALEQVRPGLPASEVDRLVHVRFEQLGVSDCWRHHTGHGVGLLVREEPYLDVGTDTVLEPGMVVTIEPGLYRPGIGGFRHSDCLLVTPAGAEILTECPRDLMSLTCRDPPGAHHDL